MSPQNELPPVNWTVLVQLAAESLTRRCSCGLRRDEVQTPALVHRKARGQTEWPGSQPGQQGTRVSLGEAHGPGGAHYSA